MDDGAFDALKAQIDSELEAGGPSVGLALGPDLYGQFRSRGLLKMSTFGWLGTNGLFSKQVPAYGSHFAFEDFEIGDLEYRIGTEGA